MNPDRCPGAGLDLTPDYPPASAERVAVSRRSTKNRSRTGLLTAIQAYPSFSGPTTPTSPSSPPPSPTAGGS